MNHCRQPGDESEHDSLHSTPISIGEPFKEFPVDVLPKPFCEYVSQTGEALGTNPVMVALPLLSALSAAVGNAVVVECRPGWLEPLPIWTGIVAEAGANKSTSINMGIQFTRTRHEALHRENTAAWDVYQSELQAWEATVSSKMKQRPDPPTKPIERRCMVSDATIEALFRVLRENPRGVLCHHDELSGLFKGFGQYKSKGGSDVAHWLSMFRAESVTVDRIGDHVSRYIPRAFVAVTGGVQPSVLRSCIAGENTENGLASRFIFTRPPLSPKKWTDACVDELLVNDCASIVGRLFNLTLPDVPLRLPFAPEAYELRKEVVNDHGIAQHQATGAVKSAFSKLEAYFFRLAGLVHLIEVAAGKARGNPSQISLRATESAAKLLDWLRYETRRVYASLGGENRIKALLDFITVEMDGQCTARELARKKSCYRSPGAAEAALQSLSRAGLGEWHTVDTAGRPASKLVIKSEYRQASDGSL